MAHGIAITEEQRAAYDAFRRGWSQPTDADRGAVTAWARRIARRSDRAFRWTSPA
jgi:hypothetical protein